MIDGFEQHRRNRIRQAVSESQMAFARAKGMSIMAQSDPPRATTEHMPFAGHRTQEQVLADMTPGERRKYLERA